MMYTLSVILFLAFIVSAAGVFKRSLRRYAIASCVFVFIALVVVAHFLDQDAKALGFKNFSELSSARNAGFTDPGKWRRYEAELAARAAEAAQLEQARTTAEQAAKAAAEATAREVERATNEARVTAERERKAAEEAACRRELRCWAEKHIPSATVYCREAVERLAINNYEWFDGWLEPKFSHYRWSRPIEGIVTFSGDKMKFQNGFGAWIIHTYECDFDPIGRRVVDVRARPGRLPGN